MATIKDIARLSGYSIGTVSRVINSHPDVSDTARAAVEQVIREIGFQPNSNARRLKQTSSSSITILVKGIQNLFLEDVLEKIQAHLRSHGEEASVVFLDESDNEINVAMQLESESRPKGFIFLGGNLEHFRNSFSKLSTPCSLVSADASGLGFDLLSSFSTDDYAGSYAACEVLLNCGHTKIGVIGGYMSIGEGGTILSRRLAGTVNCLKDHGIGFDPVLQFEPCRFSMDSGFRAAGRLLRKCPDITAVFAHSDMIAIGALRAFTDMGLRVPADMSLIGFDGIEYTRFTIPRIATVRQDTSALAEKSVNDLLMRILYERPSVHMSIPFEIIEKESVWVPRL